MTQRETTPAARPLPADVAEWVEWLHRSARDMAEWGYPKESEQAKRAADTLEAQARKIADLTARAEKAEDRNAEWADRAEKAEAENARLREAGKNLRAFVSVSARSDDAMLLAVSEWDAAALKGGDNG